MVTRQNYFKPDFLLYLSYNLVWLLLAIAYNLNLVLITLYQNDAVYCTSRLHIKLHTILTKYDNRDSTLLKFQPTCKLFGLLQRTGLMSVASSSDMQLIFSTPPNTILVLTILPTHLCSWPIQKKSKEFGWKCNVSRSSSIWFISGVYNLKSSYTLLALCLVNVIISVLGQIMSNVKLCQTSVLFWMQ